MNFADYKIHIVRSNNYKDKFVAYIEELHGVSELIDRTEDAEMALKPKFEKQIQSLLKTHQPIPKPGTGKANITFALNDKIESLRPFIDEFWEKILGTSYSTSFVSDESRFYAWEDYLRGGKSELIEKVNKEYHTDIKDIYEYPIHEVLSKIKDRFEGG